MPSEITPIELNKLITAGTPPFLLDVREAEEVTICSLPNSIHIPVAQVADRLAEIPKDKYIVVYCLVGGRSGRVVDFLKSNGYVNIANLIGGIRRWSDEVDPTVPKY